MTSAAFALLTDSLIFLPTPSSAHVQSYRTLFRKLHGDPVFCHTAFGDSFGPILWSDEEVKDMLLKRDGALRWGKRGMGDFAIGLLPTRDIFEAVRGRCLSDTAETVKIVEGVEFQKLKALDDGKLFENIEWAGYTCVRDATDNVEELHSASSLPIILPPWQEMLELRYGLDSKCRGRGLATKTARIVMQWAVEERGAQCFIAETEKANDKSGQVLQRLGFYKSGTTYFSNDSLDEWQRRVI
ncbi:hypothetical protein G7046_g8400 [Stylonectria norvegica]|nr:hypothetical protein G7046_g8400 [Stylonectria norvegica]